MSKDKSKKPPWINFYWRMSRTGGNRVTGFLQSSWNNYCYCIKQLRKPRLLAQAGKIIFRFCWVPRAISQDLGHSRYLLSLFSYPFAMRANNEEKYNQRRNEIIQQRTHINRSNNTSKQCTFQLSMGSFIFDRLQKEKVTQVDCCKIFLSLTSLQLFWYYLILNCLGKSSNFQFNFFGKFSFLLAALLYATWNKMKILAKDWNIKHHVILLFRMMVIPKFWCRYCIFPIAKCFNFNAIFSAASVSTYSRIWYTWNMIHTIKWIFNPGKSQPDLS